jgi:hypothetical protein
MDIAREIIQLARDKAYKTIVLNRSGNITGFFKAEVFSRVITSLKDVTITIVT